MTATLSEFMNSINVTKENLMLTPEDTKAYPAFVVARSLSYHRSCIDLVALLNDKNVSDAQMHYDFLIGTIPRGKKFAKWSKPEKFEHIELVCKHYHCSSKVAVEYLNLMSQEEIDALVKMYDTGGDEKIKKEKK
jgi:hypothetical protein